MHTPTDNHDHSEPSLSRYQSANVLNQDTDDTISLESLQTEGHSINNDQITPYDTGIFIYTLQKTSSGDNQHQDPSLLAHTSRMDTSGVATEATNSNPTTITAAATTATAAATTNAETITTVETTLTTALYQQSSSTNPNQNPFAFGHSSHMNHSDVELSLIENTNSYFHYDSDVDSYHTARTHTGHSTLPAIETIRRSGTTIDSPGDVSKTESGTSFKSLLRPHSLTEWLNNDNHPAQIGMSSDFIAYAHSDERLTSEASQTSHRDDFQTTANSLHTAISVPFCPVCFDSATFPIKTSCGHTFCGPCLLLVWEYQRSAFEPVKCPYCRKLVTLMKLNFSAEEERLQSEEKDELLSAIDLYNRRFGGGPRSWLQYLEDTPTVLVTLYYSDVGDLLFRWLILRAASSVALYLINYDWVSLYAGL